MQGWGGSGSSPGILGSSPVSRRWQKVDFWSSRPCVHVWLMLSCIVVWRCSPAPAAEDTNPRCCSGAPHQQGELPSFTAAPFLLIFPLSGEAKVNSLPKRSLLTEAVPGKSLCVNTSCNTPSFYRSLAAGKHVGSRCGRRWQVAD